MNIVRMLVGRRRIETDHLDLLLDEELRQFHGDDWMFAIIFFAAKLFSESGIDEDNAFRDNRRCEFRCTRNNLHSDSVQ